MEMKNNRLLWYGVFPLRIGTSYSKIYFLYNIYNTLSLDERLHLTITGEHVNHDEPLMRTFGATFEGRRVDITLECLRDYVHGTACDAPRAFHLPA